jgi:predicted DNA-binding transcriptional regulator AlpA
VTDTSSLAEEHRMVGIDWIVEATSLSKPTIRRHHEAGLIPRGCKIGRAVRWRLRTGDPKTGILDWIEAGCELAATEPSNQSESGRSDGEDAHGC